MGSLASEATGGWDVSDDVIDLTKRREEREVAERVAAFLAPHLETAETMADVRRLVYDALLQSGFVTEENLDFIARAEALEDEEL
jgi:hypothetical protein